MSWSLFVFLGVIVGGVRAQFAVQFDQSACPDTPICPTNGFSQNLTLVQAAQCQFANFTTGNGGICHSGQCEFTQVGRPNIPCLNSPCSLEGSPCFCQLPCSCLIQTLTSTFITRCISENRPCAACPNRNGFVSGSSCNLIDLKKNAEHINRSQAFCGADGLCHYQGQNGGDSFICDESGDVVLVNSSNPDQPIGSFGDNGCSKSGQLAPVGSICECFVQCACVRQYETGVNNSIAQDVAQCVLGTPVPTPFTLAPTPSPTPRPTPLPPTTPAPTPFTTGATCGGVCQLANAGVDTSLTATTCQSFSNILGACETVSFSNQTVICKIIDASFNLVPCPVGTQNPNQCPTQFSGEACSCAAPQGFCGCVIVGVLPGLPFTGTCFLTPRPTPVPPPPPTPKPTPLITGTFCPGVCPITENLAGYLATACESQSVAPGECILKNDVLTCVYFDANLTTQTCPQQIGGPCAQGQSCTCGLPANSCACIGQRTVDNAFFTALCSLPTPTTAPPTTRPSGVCNKRCALNADNTCQALDVTFAAATCQRQHCRSSKLIDDVDVDCISQECFGNDTFSPEGLPCLQCDCACTNKPQIVIDSDSSDSSSKRKRRVSSSSSSSSGGGGSSNSDREIYEYSVDSVEDESSSSSSKSSSSSSSSSSDSDTLVVRDCFTQTTLPATNAHIHVTKKAAAAAAVDDEESRKHRNNGHQHNNRGGRGPCKLCQQSEEDNFWFFCDVDECELRYNVWAWVVIGIVVCCCFATCMWAIYFAYNRRFRSVAVQRGYVMRQAQSELPTTSVGGEIPRVLE